MAQGRFASSTPDWHDVLSETEDRVYLEQLPGYAPDLNPDEGIWQYLRTSNSKTCAARPLRRSKSSFAWPLNVALFECLRHKTEVITGCFGLADLGLEGLDL